MTADDQETPRRRSRPLTPDEVLVRDAQWPGFNFGKSGWPDPYSLRGALAKWDQRGRTVHDDGSACLCPLNAAWPCACPTSCAACERRRGRGPFGRHRYGGLWPTCPDFPDPCSCPNYTSVELAEEAQRDRLERWFLSTVHADRVPSAAEQGRLF